MATRVVVFTLTNARIIDGLNQGDLGQYATWTNAVVGPDLTKVEGVPPHFWKLLNGQIVPMNKEEQEERLACIAKYGVDNSVAQQVIKFPKPVKVKLHHKDYIAYAVIILLLLVILLRQ